MNTDEIVDKLRADVNAMSPEQRRELVAKVNARWGESAGLRKVDAASDGALTASAGDPHKTRDRWGNLPHEVPLPVPDTDGDLIARLQSDLNAALRERDEARSELERIFGQWKLTTNDLSASQGREKRLREALEEITSFHERMIPPSATWERCKAALSETQPTCTDDQKTPSS